MAMSEPSKGFKKAFDDAAARGETRCSICLSMGHSKEYHENAAKQQAGVTPSAVAKLPERWRKNEDNAYRQCIYEQCAEELEQALATAPPEQAGAPQDLGSALRIDNLSRTSSPVVREETAPQAMLKAERAEAVGDMLEAYENARAITVQPDQPQAVSAGALSAEQILNMVLEVSKDIDIELWGKEGSKEINARGRIMPLISAFANTLLAAHDQKVRGEIERQTILQLMGAEPYLGRGHVESGDEFIWTVVADKVSVLALAEPAPAASKPEAADE